MKQAVSPVGCSLQSSYCLASEGGIAAARVCWSLACDSPDCGPALSELTE